MDLTLDSVPVGNGYSLTNGDSHVFSHGLKQ